MIYHPQTTISVRRSGSRDRMGSVITFPSSTQTASNNNNDYIQDEDILNLCLFIYFQIDSGPRKTGVREDVVDSLGDAGTLYSG
jgi:hypothetical protein